MLLLPDKTPARLSDEAKQAIRNLATLVSVRDVSLGESAFRLRGLRSNPPVCNRNHDCFTGWSCCARARGRTPRRSFKACVWTTRALTLPTQGLAWTHFQRRNHADGVRCLVEPAGKLQPPKSPRPPRADVVQQTLSWIGQLREFAAAIDETKTVPDDLLQQLDAAVAAQGETSVRAYQGGRDAAQAMLKDFDNRIASTNQKDAQLILQIARGSLRNYVTFPFDEAIQNILSQLDQ